MFEFPTWVAAVALTDDDKVILVRQYRHAIQETIIELPGGCVDVTDKNIDEAIKRELLEETGYSFSAVEYLGKTSPNPSTNSNFLHMYLLRGGKKVQHQQLDYNEQIEVGLVSIEELIELLQNNKIVQAMHVAAIFFALQKMGKIHIRSSSF